MRQRSISPLVEPDEIWDRLSPEAQREIGIAGVVTGIGAAGHDGSPAHPAAFYSGIIALENRVFEHAILTDVLPRPNLAALGVRSCRACGCTDVVGCPEGCCWVAQDLCSECADVRQH